MQWEKKHGLHDMPVAYDQTQTAHKHAQGDAWARARQRTGVRGAVQGSARQCSSSTQALADGARQRTGSA